MRRALVLALALALPCAALAWSGKHHYTINRAAISAAPQEMVSAGWKWFSGERRM